MHERILKTFYHRGRRTITAWTVSELARRTGMDEGTLSIELRAMSHRGLTRGQESRGLPTIWQLTAEGKEIVRRIMEAEAMARSV